MSNEMPGTGSTKDGEQNSDWAPTPPPPPPPPGPPQFEQAEAELEVVLESEEVQEPRVDITPAPAPEVVASTPPPVPQAVPAPAMPTPPVVAQQIPAPQAPGMAPPVQQPVVQAAPAGPSAIGMAFSNLWTIQGDIWTGRIADAFAKPKEVTRVTGNSAFNWLLPLGLNSLLLGLLAVAMISSTQRSVVGLVDDLFGGGNYFTVPASVYLKVFLVVSLLFFGAMMLRTVAIFTANRVSGSPASFVDAATGLGVAQTVWWMPLGIGVLLMFLMPVIAVVVLFLAFAGLALMAELLTYVGVTRQGPHKRSPLVPYAWFTVIALVVAQLFMYAFLKNELYLLF